MEFEKGVGIWNGGRLLGKMTPYPPSPHTHTRVDLLQVVRGDTVMANIAHRGRGEGLGCDCAVQCACRESVLCEQQHRV